MKRAADWPAIRKRPITTLVWGMERHGNSTPRAPHLWVRKQSSSSVVVAKGLCKCQCAHVHAFLGSPAICSCKMSPEYQLPLTDLEAWESHRIGPW